MERRPRGLARRGSLWSLRKVVRRLSGPAAQQRLLSQYVSSFSSNRESACATRKLSKQTRIFSNYDNRPDDWPGASCHASALPTELWPRSIVFNRSGFVPKAPAQERFPATSVSGGSVGSLTETSLLPLSRIRCRCNTRRRAQRLWQQTNRWLRGPLRLGIAKSPCHLGDVCGIRGLNQVEGNPLGRCRLNHVRNSEGGWHPTCDF